MAVTVQRLIDWLPNSDQYEATEQELIDALVSTTIEVAGRCRPEQVTYDPAQAVVLTAGAITTPPTGTWPEPVQQAVIMLAADTYAGHNRPGVVEFGTYVPRNKDAERKLSRFLKVF